jgi:hypothetical protein
VALTFFELLATRGEDDKELARQEGELVLQTIPRRLHLSANRFARRPMNEPAIEPSLPGVLYDRYAATGSQVFARVPKYTTRSSRW